MEKYLEGEDIGVSLMLMKLAIRKSCISDEYYRILTLCGSAFKNKGVQRSFRRCIP